MTVTSGSKVEVRLPSRLGFEKVAMSTAAGMAQVKITAPGITQTAANVS